MTAAESAPSPEVLGEAARLDAEAFETLSAGSAPVQLEHPAGQLSGDTRRALQWVTGILNTPFHAMP